MEIKLIKCEKPITVAYIEDVEKQLRISFPGSFKELYLNYNGGEPERSVWKDPSGERDPLEVRDFIPIKYAKEFKNAPPFILEGRTVLHWEEKEIPSDLVLFAMTWGADHFCISRATGKIYLYKASHLHDPALTDEQNIALNAIYLSESFSEFLSQLTAPPIAEDNPDDYAPPRTKRTKKLKCSGGGPKLKKKDIESVEAKLSISFPDSFKALYLKGNGGIPNNAIWSDMESEWEEHEIRDFLPLVYAYEHSEPMDGWVESHWAEKTLPTNLIPFATDWGDNFFCINRDDGKIYYFIRDVWSEYLSVEDNLEINARFLSNSFDDFISKLVVDDDSC